MKQVTVLLDGMPKGEYKKAFAFSSGYKVIIKTPLKKAIDEDDEGNPMPDFEGKTGEIIGTITTATNRNIYLIKLTQPPISIIEGLIVTEFTHIWCEEKYMVLLPQN